ncbi:hypothetical protein M9458_010600, partial [Cirrhinus mrigala]
PRLDLFQKLDPSRALLGNCPPSFTVSDDTLLFYVLLRDCGFLKQVTADRVTYSSMLIYDRRPELPFISRSVQPQHGIHDGEMGLCFHSVFELVLRRTVSKTTEFSAVEEDENEGPVTFSLELMNS